MIGVERQPDLGHMMRPASPVAMEGGVRDDARTLEREVRKDVRVIQIVNPRRGGDPPPTL
jgi:hypothetical protein